MEVDNPLYLQARDALARFAELVKSPEHIHTYRVTPLSIWNVCAVGETAETIVSAHRRTSQPFAMDMFAVLCSLECSIS